MGASSAPRPTQTYRRPNWPRVSDVVEVEQSGAPARAVWFEGPGAVVLRDERVPAPAVGEVTVEARLSAISHGTEMLVYRGQVPAGTTLDLPTLAGSFAYPIKYGYASVGRVSGVGDGVQGRSVGDLVFALHPHQSTYTLPAALTWRLPPSLRPERGIFAANVETALNVLLDAPIRLGERTVVFGQGAVGLLVGLLGRRNGAGRVVVVDAIERRRRLALDLGADVALSPAAATPRMLVDVCGGRPDIVYEASGSPLALQAAIDSVADEGTVVVSSWYGTKEATLRLGERFHRGRIKIHSTQVGQIAPSLSPRWDWQRRRDVVISLLGCLPLERLISQTFPLERAADAYRTIDEHPEETIQVALGYGMA
ncbi:MAG: zinc-binding dehydrogenase [Chloroflexi bacterium]|nr:zinc-binding dehydrogenase [Chloroflexota bacterium]